MHTTGKAIARHTEQDISTCDDANVHVALVYESYVVGKATSSSIDIAFTSYDSIHGCRITAHDGSLSERRDAMSAHTPRRMRGVLIGPAMTNKTF